MVSVTVFVLRFSALYELRVNTEDLICGPLARGFREELNLTMAVYHRNTRIKVVVGYISAIFRGG